MPDTYIVKQNGQEVARVTGEVITMGRKLVGMVLEGKFADDDRLLKIVKDGVTVAVLNVSSSKTVTVEKVNE